MDAGGPPDDLPTLSEEWHDLAAKQSTRERIYVVALQLYEPTRVREVADRADVSKETAREYLQWFAEIGIVEQANESPAAFVRNEAYFEWRRIQRLRGLAPDELKRQLNQLTQRERDYNERYDASGPSEVDALDHAGYDHVEEVWMDLQEWRTIRRRIRELERARRERDETGTAPA